MATRDAGQLASGITRRDFLKASAATAVVGCGLEFSFDAEKAFAYENSSQYKVTTSTCPYCSASCGQRVVTTTAAHPDGAGKVVDIYGDFESPMNSGGLCAKGAGSIQLVTNARRIGAWPGSHPVNDTFAYNAGAAYADGIAYKRTGNDAWAPMPLDTAMDEIAVAMKSARESDATLWDPATGKYNSKGVAFFGSSHVNNEPNYLYRKIIADFGTSNVEHQARI